MAKNVDLIFSLEDLFAMDTAEIENNVYQMIEPIELRN